MPIFPLSPDNTAAPAVIPGTTEKSTQTIEGTAQSNTSAILDGTTFIGKLTARFRGLMMDKSGISLLIYNESRKILIDLIDQIAAEGFYIEKFASADIARYLENPNSIPNGEILRIGASVAKIPEEVKSLETCIAWEGERVFFIPDFNIPAPKNYGAFLGMLWGKNVRAGLKFQTIRSILDDWTAQKISWEAKKDRKKGEWKLCIAEPIPLVEGKNARPQIENGVFLKPKLIPIAADENARIVIDQYECSFPTVPPGEGERFLLRKIPIEEGGNGVKVSGELIPYKKLADFSLRNSAGQNTYHTVKDGVEFLATTMSGHIFFDENTKKISISEDAIHAKPIGRDTGRSLNVSKAVKILTQQQGIAHGYSLIGNTLKFEGMGGANDIIEGIAHSKTGDVFLKMPVDKGMVISETGNILGPEIEARDGAYMEAFEGKVQLYRSVKSMLVGNIVELKSAIDCVIIADEVTIDHMVGGVIFAKKITIGTLSFPKGEGETTSIYIYIPDNLPLRKQLKAFQGYGQKVMLNIDTLHKRISLIDQKDVRLSKILQDAEIRAAWETGGNPQINAAVEQEFKTLRIFYQDQLSKQQGVLGQINTVREGARHKLNELSDNLDASTSLSVSRIEYIPDELTKIAFLRGITDEEKQRQGIRSLPLQITGYRSHDIPMQLKAPPDGQSMDYARKSLLVRQIKSVISGNIRNDARIRPITSAALLNSSIPGLSYTEITEAMGTPPPKLTEELESKEGINRRGSARHIITAEAEIIALRGLKDTEAKNFLSHHFHIPIKVDGYHIGYIRDISLGGLCIIFDLNQKFPPAFEIGEEIVFEFQFQGKRYAHSMVVTRSFISGEHIVRIAGYNVNLSEEEQRSMHKLVNTVELIIKKLRAGKSG